MARNTWEVRMNREREKLLAEVVERSGANNQAQALDLALKAYIQLDDLLEEELDEMKERADQLDGEAIGVHGYVRKSR